MKIQTIGEVVPAATVRRAQSALADTTHLTGFWCARLLRYPSGRKLPTPRLLLDPDGSPLFHTRVHALDALSAYKSAKCSRVSNDPAPTPAKPAERVRRRRLTFADLRF